MVVIEDNYLVGIFFLMDYWVGKLCSHVFDNDKYDGCALLVIMIMMLDGHVDDDDDGGDDIDVIGGYNYFLFVSFLFI